jgi:hypothetical protein
MPNAFSKEEIVAFENILEGFQDALVLSRNVGIYATDGATMERARDTIWRPMPYIAQSFDSTVGTSISSSYEDMTQLSVPSTLGFSKTSAWKLNAKELRDALQEGRLGDAAKQKLASDINRSVLNVASEQGTLVVAVAGAAGDYDDVALCDAIMNEQGVQDYDRYLALSTRDYNGLAGNLAVATRSFGNAKSDRAYERSYVGMVAGFETYKLDYANRLAAATVTAITIATNGAQVQFVPRATTSSTAGVLNVDNRTQVVTVSAVTNVRPGDCFTIAGIEAVHQITKQSTGQLKTFRVIATPTSEPSLGAAQLRISPPLIGATGTPTDAELQYKNINVASSSATASINFLNDNACNVNPFWFKDSIELLPGRYAVPTDSGAAVMRASTDQGIELVMQKFYDIDTMTIKYRLDTLYGVVCTAPEMCGVLIFGQ